MLVQFVHRKGAGLGSCGRGSPPPTLQVFFLYLFLDSVVGGDSTLNWRCRSSVRNITSQSAGILNRGSVGGEIMVQAPSSGQGLALRAGHPVVGSNTHLLQ